MLWVIELEKCLRDNNLQTLHILQNVTVINQNGVTKLLSGFLLRGFSGFSSEHGDLDSHQ